jgi:hypothetical protein
MNTMPQSGNPVYRDFTKLLPLIHYAQQHAHNRQWIGSLLPILQRKGMAHD